MSPFYHRNAKNAISVQQSSLCLIRLPLTRVESTNGGKHGERNDWTMEPSGPSIWKPIGSLMPQVFEKW